MKNWRRTADAVDGRLFDGLEKLSLRVMAVELDAEAPSWNARLRVETWRRLEMPDTFFRFRRRMWMLFENKSTP